MDSKECLKIRFLSSSSNIKHLIFQPYMPLLPPSKLKEKLNVLVHLGLVNIKMTIAGTNIRFFKGTNLFFVINHSDSYSEDDICKMLVFLVDNFWNLWQTCVSIDSRYSRRNLLYSPFSPIYYLTFCREKRKTVAQFFFCFKLRFIHVLSQNRSKCLPCWSHAPKWTWNQRYYKSWKVCVMPWLTPRN